MASMARPNSLLWMQKSQVTSLFGADELWSKGYTGEKVKMAIFDTGIRSNHPHFRNIKVLLLDSITFFMLASKVYLILTTPGAHKLDE